MGDVTRGYRVTGEETAAKQVIEAESGIGSWPSQERYQKAPKAGECKNVVELNLIAPLYVKQSRDWENKPDFLQNFRRSPFVARYKWHNFSIFNPLLHVPELEVIIVQYSNHFSTDIHWTWGCSN